MGEVVEEVSVGRRGSAGSPATPSVFRPGRVLEFLLDLEEGRPGILMTLAQIAASAAWYWFVLHRRGGWTARLPQG